jgi:endonuclease/exonuclease/phosphatase family metal-dependent hydrolase
MKRHGRKYKRGGGLRPPPLLYFLPCRYTYKMTQPQSQNNSLELFLFQLGSWLTEPACKTRELYWQSRIIDDLDQGKTKNKPGKKILLLTGMVFYAVAAIVASLPGMLLRFIASKIQKDPFLYLQGKNSDNGLVGNSFTFLSWNICCIGAGYAITDGGVLSWRYRIDRIAEKVLEMNADVISLQEVIDFDAALKLFQLLKNDYSHFYLNTGPKAFGPSGGLFVASKFRVENPEFIAFPKDFLVGRTKHMQKGFFSFDIANDDAVFARIYATHLQHSEECAFPTLQEIESRKKSMELITQNMNQVRNQNKALILSGDLNFDEDEHNSSGWKDFFDPKRPLPRKTWGGDEYCAKLVGKKVSPALDYDYILTVKGTVQEGLISLIGTKYDSKIISSDALSDHEGLLAKIVLK